MKQRYYHYTAWEDFKHGMYDEDKENRPERVQKAVELLTDLENLYEQMTRVTIQWKYATEQNLTDANINHQAFLGQTACSIWAGVHEDETREAWGVLTCEQRYKANRVADRVFKEWQARFEKENETQYQLSFMES